MAKKDINSTTIQKKRKMEYYKNIVSVLDKYWYA